jgi:hypothetical protein
MMATGEIPVPVTGTTGFLNRNLIAALFSGQVITLQQRSIL